MHRPLRAALARPRDFSLSIPTDVFFGTRRLSTTAALRQDDDQPPEKPAYRERAINAATFLSEMSSLPPASRAPPPPRRSPITRLPPAQPKSRLDPSNALVKPAEAGDIINVRTLPRGRGSAGFRGRGLRGGDSFPGTGVSDPSTSRSQFRSRPGGGGGGGAGFTRGNTSRGRGGAAGRTRARGRGARGRGRGGGDGDDWSRGRDLPEQLSDEAQAWVAAHEEGVPTPFVPSLDPDDLLGYGPAVATVTATRAGQVEGVLAGLRALGGRVPFGPETTNPDALRDAERAGNPVFFDRVDDRAYLAESEDPPAAGEAVRTALLRSVVQGLYGAGPEFAPASDVLGTVRSYAARGETYQMPDGPSVTAKVAQLLPKTARPSQKQPKAG